MKIKTVILYDKTVVQPNTLEAIADAKDGDILGVDRVEFDAFKPLIIFESQDERLRPVPPKQDPLPEKPAARPKKGKNDAQG